MAERYFGDLRKRFEDRGVAPAKPAMTLPPSPMRRTLRRVCNKR